MNKIIRYMQGYLILGFPFVIVCMIWYTINPQINTLGFSLKHVSWEILAYNLMLWFFVLILFLVSLIVSPSVREKTICYLANIKERDEREEYITGKAARSAYISNLGLLIFLLFFSIFSVSVSFSPNKPVGQRALVQIGLGFSLLDNKSESASTDSNINQEKNTLNFINYLPSKTMIILILLIWQLVAFNLAARKEKMK